MPTYGGSGGSRALCGAADVFFLRRRAALETSVGERPSALVRNILAGAHCYARMHTLPAIGGTLQCNIGSCTELTDYISSMENFS